MQVLGCGLPEWTRAVQKIQADRRQLHKRVSAYTAEVACTYAQSLLPQLLISNGWLHSHRWARLLGPHDSPFTPLSRSLDAPLR
jgi:hypothetical protein